MNNIVLLVVDVQRALIKLQPYNKKKVIENIKKIILSARKNNIEVLYLRHDDGKGTELEAGTEGWQIYDDIAPSSSERIFEKKYNSAFLKTGLRNYLESKGIDTIVLVGLQTEYCIDATCKSAFDCGYKIIIPEETNTTFDNEYLTGDEIYHFYNKLIWNDRFADIISIEELEKYFCNLK